MRDLKECPFCGSNKTAIHFNESRSGKRFYYVSCEICGSRTRGEGVTLGCISDEDDQTRIEIAEGRSIASWNQRTVSANA